MNSLAFRRLWAFRQCDLANQRTKLDVIAIGNIENTSNQSVTMPVSCSVGRSCNSFHGQSVGHLGHRVYFGQFEYQTDCCVFRFRKQWVRIGNTFKTRRASTKQQQQPAFIWICSCALCCCTQCAHTKGWWPSVTSLPSTEKKNIKIPNSQLFNRRRMGFSFICRCIGDWLSLNRRSLDVDRANNITHTHWQTPPPNVASHQTRFSMVFHKSLIELPKTEIVFRRTSQCSEKLLLFLCEPSWIACDRQAIDISSKLT